MILLSINKEPISQQSFLNPTTTMKQLKLTFIFILITAIPLLLKAQDSTSVKKNEIGINTITILSQIFSSQGAYYVPPESSFELMYKRYNGRKQAWRMGINLLLENNKVEPVVQGNTARSYKNNVSLILGSEWLSNISKRWTWYGGADIIPYYFESFSETKKEQIIQSQSDEKDKGLNLRPFLGLRFNINSRLYISTEASLNLRYGKREFSSIFLNGDQISKSHSISTGFSMNLNPAAGLYFFYKF